MVFLFHTELRFIAVPGKDGGAGFAFLYLLVSRFSYSVWDRILCLSVPLGVSFGGKSFPPTCRFVGLTKVFSIWVINVVGILQTNNNMCMWQTTILIFNHMECIDQLPTIKVFSIPNVLLELIKP